MGKALVHGKSRQGKGVKMRKGFREKGEDGTVMIEWLDRYVAVYIDCGIFHRL